MHTSPKELMRYFYLLLHLPLFFFPKLTRLTQIAHRFFVVLFEAVAEVFHIKNIFCVQREGGVIVKKKKIEVIMGSLWCDTWKCLSTNSSSLRKRGCVRFKLRFPHCRPSLGISEGGLQERE